MNERISALIGGDSIGWLDFKFLKNSKPLQLDRELKGLEFITNDQTHKRWRSFWPQSGNIQNWDAVGKILYKGQSEWLLVEAKAHLAEVKSTCGASSETSRAMICNALKKTSIAFNNREKSIESWLTPYYQYANRLAVLYFLMRECQPEIPTRLLFINFYGDERDDKTCPKSADEWRLVEQAIANKLGIDKSCELYQRIHHLYLPVNPNVV